MIRFLSALAACALAATSASAEDGWKDLFNGKDLSGWTNAGGGDPWKGWEVKDGALCRTGKAGDIWSKERFGDFTLELEFKTEGNSGVFIRTDNPKNNVQTGIEIQVEKPGGPDKHSVGALYDLRAPDKNAAKDGWNKRVTAKGGLLTVELNGEKINAMNLDEWTEAQKNPDGSKNKFKTALKDFKRDGHIGFQDHDHNVCYRSVRIKAE